MSNEKDQQSYIKYCVYCGTKVTKEKVYCPNCGKLVIKVKPKPLIVQEKDNVIKPSKNQKQKVIRKCPGCGSTITSSILEQCPICNAKLDKIIKSKEKSAADESKTKTGFIFTNKKLIPEQKFVLNKASWNFREGFSVFGNSIMVYIIIRLLISVIITFQMPLSEPINITTIILSQLPDIIFGVYPIWYIYSKKHDMRKLGFSFSTKKFLITVIIGIIGGLVLILINDLSNSIIELMIQFGIDFGDIFSYIAFENQVIREAEIYWIILLMFLLNISVFSTEIVYRGVLHNTLKSHFGKDVVGKIGTIIIVALIYSVLYLIFSLPLGIYFFLINFIIFLILGILYEVNQNLYNPIIASILYNTVLIILVILP
jgi:membrane protease YdiL (CAAX protease family)